MKFKAFIKKYRAAVITVLLLGVLAAAVPICAASVADEQEFPDETSAPADISVTFTLDGVSSEYTVPAGERVVDLLTAQGITLGGFDTISVSPAAALEDGMNVSLDRAYTVIERVSEPIPHERTLTPSEYVPRGTVIVTAEGADGELQHIYTVMYRGGVEISRTLEASAVTRAPVTETAEYGTGGSFTAPDGTVVEWLYKIDGEATAYTIERETSEIMKLTRVGTPCRVGAIAVDPRVIPLRSTVYIEGANKKWEYGVCACEDTGGAIKGNIVDLFFDTWDECVQFGRRKCTIYVMDTP